MRFTPSHIRRGFFSCINGTSLHVGTHCVLEMMRVPLVGNMRCVGLAEPACLAAHYSEPMWNSLGYTAVVSHN